MNLPLEFENRMKELLGSEFETFAHALQREDAVKGLRVNENKVSIDAFLQNAPFAVTEIPYVRGGFIVSEDAQAGKHSYHHAGVYYMQDPGAMATVAALPRAVLEQNGVKVLDVCAAPGGKTTQLASAVAGLGGMVLANEYNAARSHILAGNVERMGLDNVCVTNLDSKYLAEWYSDFFDLVVVDAPCSGEGMFRKNDLAISEWSPANVTMCAERQTEILQNAACCVTPGGYLIYSTCTYSIEENEAVVAAFLESHPSFSICSCDAEVAAHTADGIDVTGGECPSLTLCRRFYPHVSPGEGQFVALLRRDADALATPKKGKDTAARISKADRVVVDSFLRETIGRECKGLCLCGGNVSSFAARETLGFCLPPFGVVAVGATLGEIRKGRLVPHHHFFTAYGDLLSSKVILDCSDPSVARYLAGEEIDVSTSESGFCAVLLSLGEEAVTLGGGKAVGGRLKNYYPKGLRVKG